MSAVIEAEKILSTLTRDEKAQVLEWIARDLGETSPNIEKIPGVCGGSARIVRTRIPVWTLEQYRRLNMTEAEILLAFPTLRAADLVNAWNYVQVHQAEIDQDIKQNDKEHE